MKLDCAFSFCSSTCSPPAAVLPRLCCRQRHDPPWNEPKRTLYHRIRPQPARRRSSSSSSTSSSKQRGHHELTQIGLVHNPLWAILLCLLFLCPGTTAHQVYGASDIFPTELLFDRSEPPAPILPRMILERRQDGLPSTPAIKPTGSATAGSTIQTATSNLPTTLPRPFDTSIGNNFTSNACPAFFSGFLNNDSFRNCLPLSMLLQTSSSFFSISKSLLRLTQTLDVSCNVDLTACSTLMADLAQEIQQDTTCGPDLQMQNPVVTQAYNGLIAYPTLYHAGCLTDADGNYCYANAVTNASSPSSSYIYYLPLGVQLPGGARPTCNQCLQNTMAIFAETATNATQPLNSNYVGAAEQIQMNCGPTFVQSTIASSAGRSLAAPSMFGFVLLATLLTTIL